MAGVARPTVKTMRKVCREEPDAFAHLALPTWVALARASDEFTVERAWGGTMASGVANGSNTANRIIASILLTEENILLIY